jgi:hypothetical protein
MASNRARDFLRATCELRRERIFIRSSGTLEWGERLTQRCEDAKGGKSIMPWWAMVELIQLLSFLSSPNGVDSSRQGNALGTTNERENAA